MPIYHKAYTTLGTTVSFKPANTNFTLSFYGKNLTNQAVLEGTFPNTTGFCGYWQPPREFGGSIG